MAKQKPGRPRCRRCGKLMSLNSDGTFRFHMTKDSMRTCHGSGETPAQQKARLTMVGPVSELNEAWEEFILDLFRRETLIFSGGKFYFNATDKRGIKPVPHLVSRDLETIILKQRKPQVEL